MLKTCFKVIAVVVLILLPVGILWINLEVIESLYWEMTKYPDEITIPTGPEGGQHEKITDSLRADISAKLDVKLGDEVETVGSLENLRALQKGKIDFALYQAGTANSEFKNLDTNNDSKLSFAEFESGELDQSGELDKHALDTFSRLNMDGNSVLSLDEFKATSSVAFVANIYPEVAHFIVRRGAEIKHPGDLRGKRVALGNKKSGHYAMSRILLEHFGLDEKRDIHAKYLSNDEIEERLLNDQLDEDKKLDAAFITVGIQAEVLQKLFATGKCKLLSIPFADALAKKHALISTYKIPAGLYRFQAEAVPAENIETVALPAQLLTRKDLNSGFIQQVTRIVLDQHFASQNNLHELLETGPEFAQANPEFPTHPGAQSVYDPEFDIHLIESWEAAYSLAVSTLIAVFFGVRWLRKRKARKKGHKLDVYIQKLLNIEERQVCLDADSQANDLPPLQKLLDDVTFLRQEALRVFSVHELNEDRGADCFIEMCHALSNKINAKISRQRLDKRFDELTKAIRIQNQQQSA